MLKQLLKVSTLCLAFFAVSGVFAQSSTAVHAQDRESDRHQMPYINYKGITDVELAKQAWVDDNPEAYAALLGNNGGSSALNNLAITTLIPNDSCVVATPIACGSSTAGSNVGATAVNAGCGPASAPAVWYSFVGDGNSVVLTTCSFADFDTRINVFSGACNALNFVGCNDDSCGLQSGLTIQTTPGTVYYAAVSGFGGAVGSFQLDLIGSCTSPSNTCTNPVSINMIPSGLKPFWGLSDPYTFYYGVSQWKPLKVTHSGGVGPYTYAWGNAGSGQLKNQSPDGKRISLFEPTGPAKVWVTVSDQGTGCDWTDTLDIAWDNSMFCGTMNPKTWYLTVCEDGVTKCVSWGMAKSLIKGGNADIGACAEQPAKMAPTAIAASLYPNPTNDLTTIEYASETAGEGTLMVMDMNGRVLQQSTVMVNAGKQYQGIDLSDMPTGVYIVRLSTDHDVFTERLQLVK